MTTIVLAAGLSSRMGENKLLLPYKGKAVVCHVVEKALEVSDRTLVVVGHEKERIEEALRNHEVDFVFNAHYEEGQRTSVMEGIRSVGDDDFLITPGDLPLLREEDFRLVAKALEEASVARCFHEGTPGHPVAFRKENRERLLAHPGTMKDYLKNVGCASVEGSLGTILDVDTPARYKALVGSDGDLVALNDSLH